MIPVGSPTPTPASTDGAVATQTTPAGGGTSGSSTEPSANPSPTLVPTEVKPTPKPATGTPATYKIKRGDTLSAIAAKFGTTVKVLVKLNKIDDPSKIRVGQILKLPKS